MRNSLWRFFLCLSVGAAGDCRAHGPAKLPPSVRASSLIGRWTLVGTTSIKRTSKAQHPSSVATTTVRCNRCPDVHFQANGRGAFLAEGSQDTLSRFQWHVAQQVLTLRIAGPQTAEDDVLPSGTYRLRVMAPTRSLKRMDLLDKQGVAHELVAEK
jgi:hypothetical protein